MGHVLRGAGQDLRYGVRLLRRQPGIAAVPILMMTLGIGVTTMLFSVAYGVLLKPLPWSDAAQLVRVTETRERRSLIMRTIRPVGFGLFVGAGSAAGLAALLLATPAAATIGEIVDVLDPVAYIMSLLIIIAACLAAAAVPAIRASRLDPTRARRQE